MLAHYRSGNNTEVDANEQLSATKTKKYCSPPCGYSCEYDVERYVRDTPLMILGEGHNTIQHNAITEKLVTGEESEHVFDDTG